MLYKYTSCCCLSMYFCCIKIWSFQIILNLNLESQSIRCNTCLYKITSKLNYPVKTCQNSHFQESRGTKNAKFFRGSTPGPCWGAYRALKKPQLFALALRAVSSRLASLVGFLDPLVGHFSNIISAAPHLNTVRRPCYKFKTLC